MGDIGKYKAITKLQAKTTVMNIWIKMSHSYRKEPLNDAI